MAIKHPIVAIVGAFAAALAVGGIAEAITDTSFQYSTPQTGYYTIAHMAMLPDGTATVQKDYLIDRNDGLTVDQAACFNSGINLPQNATVTEVTVYYASGATSDVFGQIRRTRLTDGSPQSIAATTFANNAATRTAGDIPVTAARAVIKNNNFLYAFALCLGNGDVFYAARITYEYTSAGS